MNLHFIDWAIIAGLLTIIISMAFYTKKFNRSVADFLAANRTAGRYMLCIADGMSALGAITIVMLFEIFYQAGFPGIWWDMFRLTIIPAVLSLSGWVIYRFRQTRALTLAQFFEMRYSRRFRIFCGIIIWFSGILNFGIFPAVGARFFMNYMGIEETTGIYVAFMLALISISLFFTFVGGQITVMVTDFIQGAFCNIMFLIIIITAMFMFKWDDITATLSKAPENASMINPFDVAKSETFNLTFYMILAFTAAYGFLSWQGAQGYNSAALNAHEARMGKSLSVWRLITQNLFVLMLPICAYTFMNNPAFAQQAQPAHEILSSIENQTIRQQVTATVALRHILPIGIQGGLMAVMLAAFISTHDTYLHSWGSIFVQDVILPFRNRPLTKEQHMRYLKLSILGVAVFIFFFSLFFRQSEAIIMFFQITGAIFIGGAGSVIIGGLYWKRGTTAGAWAAMITGAVLSVGTMTLRQIHVIYPFTNKAISFIISQHSTTVAFWVAISSISMYIIFSLIWPKTANLDKLLHRGIYAVEQDKTRAAAKPVNRLKRLIGLNEDFNRKDQIIYLAMVSWTFMLIAMFAGLITINFFVKLTDSFWITFWRWFIYVSIGLSAVTTTWFTIGGLIDMKKMFARLRARIEDDSDDGTVTEDYMLKE
ncbi:Proline permease [Limihaloglobus sulfuriphilus]|uniref:Proline permease n=1 Tax=Limihaloglobus sulfuriphilus TaxID=1851148 RepID=A0A1R7T5U0_9BACT|nr:sodium:solute symporter [Limihaloglobus sulfuriphilus]AQQ71766.1 Proline permease [Limihaloglobus sulfuriphilus]